MVVLFLASWIWHQAHWNERRIHRRMDELVRVVEKPQGEKSLPAMAQAQRLTGYFADGAMLDLKPTISYAFKKDALTALYMQVHARVDALAVQVTDRRLTLEPDKTNAVMRLTATAQVTIGAQTEDLVHEIQLKWIKLNHQWFISDVKQVQGIRRPWENEGN